MKKAKKEDKIIDLNYYSEQESEALKGQVGFLCPHCLAPVRFKKGPRRRAHFAHLTPCRYKYSESESEVHRLTKERFASWLKNQGIWPEVERHFREINRIADIYFEWNSNAYVIEIQKSAISESLFQARTEAYKKFEITVLWIFIGEIIQKKYTFNLNRVMSLNKEASLIHFDLPSETLTFFWQMTWVSRREIESKHQSYLLSQLKIADLVSKRAGGVSRVRDAWLEIKTDFRKSKCHAYMRQEKGLLQLCAKQRINLALLPPEVGWPVSGNGLKTSIFIWQGYIVMLIVDSYEQGDFFTFSEVLSKLKKFRRFVLTKESFNQIYDYLKLLVKIEMLTFEFNYFEYKKAPIFYSRLEQVIEKDQYLSIEIFSE